MGPKTEKDLLPKVSREKRGTVSREVFYNVNAIIIMIIIIIALKGAIQDFYNLLTSSHTVSNMHAQVAWAESCANHDATYRTLIT